MCSLLNSALILEMVPALTNLLNSQHICLARSAILFWLTLCHMASNCPNILTSGIFVVAILLSIVDLRLALCPELTSSISHASDDGPNSGQNDDELFRSFESYFTSKQDEDEQQPCSKVIYGTRNDEAEDETLNESITTQNMDELEEEVDAVSMKEREEIRQKIIAVLIDADNIPYRNASAILHHAQNFGKPALCRVYGDWSRPLLTTWMDKAKELGLDTRQQNTNSNSRNATDIGMVVDAMDLLYQRNFDGFMIASSDSDFTQLATRLRENGKLVVGFGDIRASNVLQNACDHYVSVSTSSSPSAKKIDPMPNSLEDGSEWRTISSYLKRSPPTTPTKCTKVNGRSGTEKLLKKDAKFIYMAMHRINSEAPDGEWFDLALIGKQLSHMSDFDMKKYGFTKLTDFVSAISYFEVDLEGRPKIRKRCRSARGNIGTKHSRSEAEKMIRVAVSSVPSADWYKLAEVGAEVHKIDPTFKSSKYGAQKLLDIIQEMPDFHIRWIQGLPQIRPILLPTNAPDTRRTYSTVQTSYMVI